MHHDPCQKLVRTIPVSPTANEQVLLKRVDWLRRYIFIYVVELSVKAGPNSRAAENKKSLARISELTIIVYCWDEQAAY